MRKLLDVMLGRSGRAMPEPPIEVRIIDDWDYAIWLIPWEEMHPDTLNSTLPPTMRLYRRTCDIVGDELHYHHGSVTKRIRVDQCKFYKEN